MNSSPTEGAQGSANSKTPTPMTDCVTMNRHCSLIGPNDDIVFADFARQLERQLAQSEERVAAAMAQLDMAMDTLVGAGTLRQSSPALLNIRKAAALLSSSKTK